MTKFLTLLRRLRIGGAQPSGGRDPKEVFSKDGLFDELKKALAERVLNAEIDDHLDGEAVEGRKNQRNGYSSKRVIPETSKLDIRVPRDLQHTAHRSTAEKGRRSRLAARAARQGVHAIVDELGRPASH